MWRKTLLCLCAAIIVLLGLVATATVYAVEKKNQNLGPSIKIPQGASVQMQGNGKVTVKGGFGSWLGEAGTYYCSCSSRKGTCTIATDGGMLICGKGTGAEACTSTCEFTTSSTGIQ